MRTPIPWLRVFVEGVVIVGSILLALGIQAWWDEVKALDGFAPPWLTQLQLHRDFRLRHLLRA